IVCGDSHTSTHGAFGALAFGIGTSEVEHVLATQTLPQPRPGTMAVRVDGPLPAGVVAKDVILGIIGQIGTGGGIGHVVEYQGAAIDGAVPDPESFTRPAEQESAARALGYMGLAAGTPLRDIAVDTVFIGSCTNARLEDLRAAASVLDGRRVRSGLRALVVPG